MDKSKKKKIAIIVSSSCRSVLFIWTKSKHKTIKIIFGNENKSETKQNPDKNSRRWTTVKMETSKCYKYYNIVEIILK